MNSDTGFDLLIFDCDGTLVDSEYLNNLATIELLSEQGLPQYDLDYAYEHFIGMKFADLLKMVSMETGHVFPANITQRYIARAHALIPAYLRPIDGAAELISAAREKMKIAVASNGQRDNVFASLEMAGLLGFFDEKHILTGTDVKNGKPAPDLFLISAERQGVKPERCLVIEDSVTGTTGAVAAGMVVYGFTGAHQNPASYAKKLENAGASKVYNSLIHIRDALYQQK